MNATVRSVPRTIKGAAALLLTGALIVAGAWVWKHYGNSVSQVDRRDSDAVTRAHKRILASRTDETSAAARFSVPDGLRVNLIAAEPHLTNPVSFCFDERGRIYVAETHRLDAGAMDIRGHMDWLDDDLACRSVADRIALLRRRLGESSEKYATNSERVRRLEWRNGAIRSEVFADGFNALADGIGAGLLARGEDVWYTCIPHLWRLSDSRSGEAPLRAALHTGYGIRIGYEGHDLHGLTYGFDGRLYFTMGDRGLHVVQGDRQVSCPDSGAVLRCDPDGANLELFAFGLRNPQELAFDEYGNLFTCDNSSDIGEPARWVHVVEGGDSGWRIGYQFLREPIQGGPWYAENLWQRVGLNTAAYVVPPIGHVSKGPSGLTYHPGVTLLPERFERHFFLADFCGSSGASGVHYLANRPDGATFTLAHSSTFWWRILATDVDFGPDGGLYVTDWTEGWTQPNKGRLYQIEDPNAPSAAACQAVQRLLADGVSHCTPGELIKRLGHADRRVRQAAQFALAEAGPETIPLLTETARTDATQLARIHAIWALGQKSRKHSSGVTELVDLLHDPDAEVRAQIARVIGEARHAAAGPKLISLLQDPEPRVRFFAVQSLGLLQLREAASEIVALVRENADRDAVLRHAAVLALMRINEVGTLRAAAANPSVAVRLAVLLTWRRQTDPAIQVFLNDPEERLVLEAARAIYDGPIPDALPQLAALVRRVNLAEPIWHRVVNAHYRLGEESNAEALASVSIRADVPAVIRVLVLQLLRDWATPPGRDRVTGLWRPLSPRGERPAVAALKPHMDKLLMGDSEVAQAAVNVISKLKIKESGAGLWTTLQDVSRPLAVRIAALKALRALSDSRLDDAVQYGIAAADPLLRVEARSILVEMHPEQACSALALALENGAVVEQQRALHQLAEQRTPEADRALLKWLDRRRAGRVPAEIELDLLEAATQRDVPELQEHIADAHRVRSESDLRIAFRDCLVGGDADAGWRVFYGKPEVACSRCHRIKNDGGDIGPELSRIGAVKDRAYILESVVHPNARVADGYETVHIENTNGGSVTGILKVEDQEQIKLVTADGESVMISKACIVHRSQAPSAMPADASRHLTRRELRDLVEFLATRN